MAESSADLDRLLNDLADRIAEAVTEKLSQQTTDVNQSDGLLDEPAMAKRLGISPQTLRRRRMKGEVPCVRVGRRVVYKADDALAALRAQQNGGEA